MAQMLTNRPDGWWLGGTISLSEKGLRQVIARVLEDPDLAHDMPVHVQTRNGCERLYAYQLPSNPVAKSLAQRL